MRSIVKFQKLRQNAKIPTYETDGAAGADLSSAADSPILIPAGGRALIPTGIAVECARNDAALLIFARSGLASKHGIALANGVGLVDPDYRGELCVALVNLSDEDYTVNPGERVAQLVLTPVIRAIFTERDSLGQTNRGSGGFGSTGVR